MHHTTHTDTRQRAYVWIKRWKEQPTPAGCAGYTYITRRFPFDRYRSSTRALFIGRNNLRVRERDALCNAHKRRYRCSSDIQPNIFVPVCVTHSWWIHSRKIMGLRIQRPEVPRTHHHVSFFPPIGHIYARDERIVGNDNKQQFIVSTIAYIKID